MYEKKTILILDYGSQYTQLIARRIRELNVYSEIVPYNTDLEKIKNKNPIGIILSGGPMSVYETGAPELNKGLLKLGLPVLGICYGMQLLADYFGGKVEPASNREYGKASVSLDQSSPLFEGVSSPTTVWMSHGDYISRLPEGFSVIAKSANSPVAAFVSKDGNAYGLQFHPEVVHSIEGTRILRNFVLGICKAEENWTSSNFIESSVASIRNLVGQQRVLCALSGGVDSSVAAVLLDRAIGKSLTCIHVDSGLMRAHESTDIVKMFADNFSLKVIHVDASEIFLSRLRGVKDPEKKRKIIGSTFIDVFDQEARKIGGAKFLVQGTLYPDVIESVPVKGQSQTIKSHHNVGGLPEKMNLKLIEPFRELFKDEVRAIGRQLGLPKDFIRRHPFPGPGLAVRILGEVTDERLEILRAADEIYIDEIFKAGLYDEIWQAFAVLLPIETVGVMGDQRTYEKVLALRAVTSVDGMTADWYRFPYEVLEKISNRIVREIRGINRVVLDISSKPPSTIEWE